MREKVPATGIGKAETFLRLPKPVPIRVRNDERVAFVITQVTDDGLVNDRIAAEILAR